MPESRPPLTVAEGDAARAGDSVTEETVIYNTRDLERKGRERSLRARWLLIRWRILTQGVQSEIRHEVCGP